VDRRVRLDREKGAYHEHKKKSVISEERKPIIISGEKNELGRLRIQTTGSIGRKTRKKKACARSSHNYHEAFCRRRRTIGSKREKGGWRAEGMRRKVFEVRMKKGERDSSIWEKNLDKEKSEKWGISHKREVRP